MINFNEHTKLVYFVFEKYFKRYQFYKDDLCQEGLFTLWKACKSFDSSKNVKFSSYAIQAIKNNMLCYLRQREFKHMNNITFSELEENDINTENLFYTTDNFDLDLTNIINNALNELPSKNQNIIKEYFLQDISQVDLAIKYQTSQMQVSRVTQKFKKQIKKII